MFITSLPDSKRQGMEMKRATTLALCLMLAISTIGAHAATPITTAVYFTGIGCPHCARTDPVLLEQQVRETDLLVVEYEIYQDSVNAPLLMYYADFLGDVVGIPALIAGSGQGRTLLGDWPILEGVDLLVLENRNNGVPLVSGTVPFADIDLVALWGKPKIWFQNRVAIRSDLGSRESDGVKSFVLDGTLPDGCEPCTNTSVSLSGAIVVFREAFAFNGWLLLRD